MRTLIFWIVLFPLSGFTQADTALLRPPPEKRPPYTLKIAPLALLNPVQQTLMLEADIPLSPSWGIAAGAGLIFNSASSAAHRGESYWGLKLKPAIKYYTRRLPARDNYISLAFKYNMAYNDHFLQVSRQGTQYTEWLHEYRKITTTGVALCFGSQEYLGSRKQGIFESFIGLGVRQGRVRKDALPVDARSIREEPDDFLLIDRSPGTYITPDFLLGFTFGWLIGK